MQPEHAMCQPAELLIFKTHHLEESLLLLHSLQHKHLCQKAMQHDQQPAALPLRLSCNWPSQTV